LDTLREAVSRHCGCPIDVRPLPGSELVRSATTPTEFAPSVAALPGAERVGSLRQRAIAAQPRTQRRAAVYASVAGILVVAAVATAVALLQRSGGPTATGTSTAAVSPSAGTVTTMNVPVTSTFGRVQVQLPADWHVGTQTDTRVDLSPNNGARERITLIQRPLIPGAGLDDVAGTLDAQIKSRPAGTVGDLHRNTVFGGRSGLAYDEFPADGTTVRWQVLVDSGLQVSVGCQYVSGNWQPIAGVCEGFVHDLRINP
jgi:type VII secretion-associated protein (TIGR03931 family)